MARDAIELRWRVTRSSFLETVEDVGVGPKLVGAAAFKGFSAYVGPAASGTCSQRCHNDRCRCQVRKWRGK